MKKELILPLAAALTGGDYTEAAKEAFESLTFYEGKGVSTPSNSTLTKKQKKSRSKSKAARKARKKNRK